jgi:DNA-binding NarL/FixJ family response regulator
LVAAGNLPEALELAGRLERLGSYGIDLRLPLIDAAVEANLAAGRVTEAERLAVQVAEAAPDHPLRQRVQARLLVARGDDADALALLHGAVEGFVRTGHRQDEWHTRRLLARSLHNLGRRRDARAELHRVDDEIAAARGFAPRGGASGSGPDLSPREREVAVLVAQGLRNREIAERLFISERTVENHIHRVLERSGLRSRVELAALVAH